MTDVADLLATVTDHWTDRNLALVVADAVEERDNKGRFAALRVVARARRVFTDAAEVSGAGFHVGHSGDYAADLDQMIRALCRIREDRSYNLILIPGRMPPKRALKTGKIKGGYWCRYTVTVGARWVLHQVDALTEAQWEPSDTEPDRAPLL